MKILCVVNPVSGDKDKRFFVNNIKEYCRTYGIECVIYYTSRGTDADYIGKMIRAIHFDKVISVGGDGTMRLLAGILKGSGIPLGYVPFGSANGLKEDIRTGSSPWQSFENVMKTYLSVPLDVIEVNGHDCIHVADVGINAQIVKAYDKDNGRGLFTYAKYLMGALSTQEKYKFVIRTGGKEYSREGCMLAIANGTKYGTGLRFNAKGNPFDGQFEILVVKNISIMTLLRAGWATTYKEITSDSDNYFIVSTREADIRISRVTTLQVDGEVTGRFDSLHVKMLDDKVAILIPRHEFTPQNEDDL